MPPMPHRAPSVFVKAPKKGMREARRPLRLRVFAMHRAMPGSSGESHGVAANPAVMRPGWSAAWVGHRGTGLRQEPLKGPAMTHNQSALSILLQGIHGSVRRCSRRFLVPVR